jgi:two-component system, NarL family, response regulator DevR
VIGEAGTASAALARIPAVRPDVAVLDVRLPDGDGILLCREVRSWVPGVACLMFTAFSDDQARLDSIMAGAAGYLLKQVRGSDLAGAVRAAAAGQSLLPRRAASQVMAWLQETASRPDPLAGLTRTSAASVSCGVRRRISDQRRQDGDQLPWTAPLARRVDERGGVSRGS